MKKLQYDFEALKMMVEAPIDESKQNKLDERNIKLDDFTGQGEVNNIGHCIIFNRYRQL